MTDRYLERLFQDSHIVEIRHQVNSRWESGLFDDLGKAQQAIWEKAHQGSLYTSLNRPYLRPVPNAFGTAPLRNEDIQTVTRLVLDFDPERPSGISSTDAEIAAACRVRDQVVTTLRAVGWPMPALGMSGNGAHAVFRACLHPDDAWRQGSALLYAGLRQQFEYLLQHERVRFDSSVRNPGRIWRLYGTVNRKGTPTVDRPHREATITLPAGPWGVVRPEHVNCLINVVARQVIREPHIQQSVPMKPRQDGAAGDYRTLDVVAWFQSHGRYLKLLADDGVHAVRCPWSYEHTTCSGLGETVVFENPGQWPGFHCHHDHCRGRSITDVMGVFGDADRFCTKQWAGSRHG